MKTDLNTENIEFLNNVINTLSDPVFVKDDKHTLVLVNNAYSVFLGVTNEQIIGKSDYDFFPKNQVDVFWEKDDEILNSGKINTNEEKITNFQGQVRDIVTKKSLYTDLKGRKFIVGIIRDITEMKKMRELSENNFKEIKEMNVVMLKREVKMAEIKIEIETIKKELEIQRCQMKM